MCFCAACDPFHTGFDDVERAEYYRAAEIEPAEVDDGRLLIMTYNVKFGGGRIDFFFDCHGDRVLMTDEEVRHNLDGLAAKIASVGPDILLIQEVDVNSKRAAYRDELEWLLRETSLNYAVYASQWRADYVPSDGIGPVDSGNAILSKFPVRNARRIALPLRGDQGSLERYFYLRRNLLTAEIELPQSRLLRVVATHTAAYSTDGTKREHIRRFEREIDELAEQGLVVAGGDLNALPPGTEKTKDFDDSACTDEFEADDYSEETDWLSGLYAKYDAAIPLEDYERDNTPYFSHTTRRDGFWNRKLDYLFTNGSFAEGSGLVHQNAASGGMETMPLSDHAPLSVELELP